MKRFAPLLLTLLMFVSCSEEITRNSPALQGLKDDEQWRAIDSQATLGTDGSITIVGLTQNETLTLRTAGHNDQIYLLGTGSASMASYEIIEDGSTLTYSTGANMGDGQIEITEYDELNMTVTGTFRFNAENVDNNPLGGEILNYREGVFYRVPVVPAL